MWLVGAVATFLVGIETEFILLRSVSPIVTVSEAPWSSTSKLATGSTAAKVLEEIVSNLKAMGIQVLMYHSEGAPGQVISLLHHCIQFFSIFVDLTLFPSSKSLPLRFLPWRLPML